MDNKKINIVLIILSSFLTLFFSYFVFIAGQAFAHVLMYSLSEALPVLGVIFTSIEIVALVVFIYKFYTYRKFDDKYLPFLKRNGLFHIITSSICLGFSIYSTIIFKNWTSGGITYLFPFDFIALDVICLVVGISIIVFYKKIKPRYVSQEESTSKPLWKTIIKCALLYFFMFIALNRLGSIVCYFLVGVNGSIMYLIPVILLNLCPIAMVVCYVLYRNITNEKVKSNLRLVSSLVIFVVTVACFIYYWVMNNGSMATDFLRM